MVHSQAPQWVDFGVPFFFVSNIREGEIHSETSKYVSEETYHELTRNCPIEIGDVLYTAVGSYGNAACVRTADRFIFQRHIAHIKPKQELIRSEYLRAVLETSDLRRQADRVARGVAQKTVTLADLKKFDIPLPPMEMQVSFCEYEDKVRKLKMAHQQSSRQLDGLFKSLQHRAFRGEL